MEILKILISADALPFLAAFAVTALLGPMFIPWLHKLKFGQEIRDEGPKWHQKKSGTPTMGGIMFIVGIAAAIAAVCVMEMAKGSFNSRFVLVPLIAIGFGAVGFIDDFIKVAKKRNLGLTSLQKLLLQLLITVVYVIAAYLMGDRDYSVVIPFVSYTVQLPVWIYIPFIMFVMVGVVNAVNLTDGLDGLAASVTLVVALFFTVVGIMTEGSNISAFAAAIAGGMAGFLIYNHHPAKVFMGDTGSLFLGGAIAIMAIDTHLEFFLIIAGFVYFAETLSVIIQTSYFKYTKRKYGEGRRVFKMTPIHHHFEMCKWSEKKIVLVFSLTTLVLCAVTMMIIPFN